MLKTLALLIAARASDAFSPGSTGAAGASVGGCRGSVPIPSSPVALAATQPRSRPRPRGQGAERNLRTKPLYYLNHATNHSAAASPYAYVEDPAAILARMRDLEAKVDTASVGVAGVDSLLDWEASALVEAHPRPICDDAPSSASALASSSSSGPLESVLSSYAGPRAILALVAVLYGTNFPLGAIMNDALPASAATSSRMVLASLVLSPFLVQLKPGLRSQVLLGGAFVSLGYVSQSLALVDTSPALVSFLGSATVLVCPILQWLVDKKPMGIKDAPQTWLAAFLCLSGVAALELIDSSAGATSGFSVDGLGVGDALSLLQAVGFGIGCFMSEKMMHQEKDQALQITAGLVTTTAFFTMLWCLADGWMREPGWESMGLPGLFLDPDMRTVVSAFCRTRSVVLFNFRVRR
ncbi:hypothetical protein ACHAWF_014024 [Thalassiosira exigua]